MSGRPVRRLFVAVALVASLLGIAASPASATFHEIYIRSVYPGSVAEPESEFVELQMWSSGQEFVNGHHFHFYDASGAEIKPAEPVAFKSNVGNGANQSTILVATPAAETAFGVSADLEMPANYLDPGGGAVCWEALDCVAWGSFTGSTPSPVGAPASPGGIADGKGLKRSIARGCETLLEASDDRDDSAGDFAEAFPAPRPNSVAPSEKSCSTGGGGKGGDGDKGAPQTTLKRKPAKRSADRTPTFRFVADEDRASFQCRIDKGRFKACRSPFTTKRLSFGSHTFRVRAKDSSGEVDPSPATYRFKIVRKKR